LKDFQNIQKEFKNFQKKFRNFQEGSKKDSIILQRFEESQDLLKLSKASSTPFQIAFNLSNPDSTLFNPRQPLLTIFPSFSRFANVKSPIKASRTASSFTLAAVLKSSKPVKPTRKEK
jgi:hypothetical protein